MKSHKAQLKVLKPQLRPKAPAVLPCAPAEAEPDFARLFADVTPVKSGNRVMPSRPAPPHWPRQHPQPRLSADDLDGALIAQMSGWFDRGDEPEQHLANGVARNMLKRLRERHWPIVATLDLHGLDRYQAHSALALFLHQARGRGHCARVVHGMGYGSQGEPVLPRMVRRWLACHPHVLAFCTASARDGGQGALLVLLKRPPPGQPDCA